MFFYHPYQTDPNWFNHPQGQGWVSYGQGNFGWTQSDSYQNQERLIQYGSRGQNVRAVQQRLNQLGYNVGAVDGIFGPRTLAGVRAFQRSHGLTVDGVVGPKTWRALFGAATTGGFHHPEHWNENSVLRRGASGFEVKNLQYIINVMGFYTESGVTTADGIFGPKTEQAVKTYQRGNGLNPDGIVGPKTWMSFSKFIEKKDATTYGAGGYMGLRLEWRYDSTSDQSACTVLVYGNGTDLSDQFRLYPR